jgi:hypothetical protein
MKTFTALLIGGLLASPVFANDTQDRAAASRAAIKELGAALQGELQSAIKAGGPLNAIKVCNTKAPKLAEETSAKQGWKVGRTSLKTRNPDNAPDAWETKVLQEFDRRKGAGEDTAKLEQFEVVTENGKKTFRYMKAIAIPENAPCVNCHGDKIEAKVQDKLKELYPKDQATGYKTGDLRGAFTVKQPL